MSAPDLLAFAQAVSAGSIRVVDLTQTLTQDFPTIVLPPEFGQCAPFRMEEVSRYDERGPAWYWNNLTVGEHTGTHFDAPIHWISGKDLPNNAVDTIDPRKFIAPAVRYRLLEGSGRRRRFRADRSLRRSVGGASTAGSTPEAGYCCAPTGRRSLTPTMSACARTAPTRPGPTPDVVKWLVEERDVHGFGTETIGTDTGQAQHFNPPYPAHFYMHGKGRYGLQCLTNLDLLPPKGAVIIAAPLKIKQGSGSPLRVLALVP